jgi:pre-rRNA-processing protein IPI1
MPQAHHRALPPQLPAVTAHIIRLLRGEPAPGSSGTMARPISAQAYIAVLPSLWALINVPATRQASKQPKRDEDVSGVEDVLRAALEHALRASSASAVKQASVEFIGRLVLVSAYLLVCRIVYAHCPGHL